MHDVVARDDQSFDDAVSLGKLPLEFLDSIVPPVTRHDPQSRTSVRS
jgi:hypothetical protein